VSAASVGTRSAHRQVIIPPDVLIPVSDEDGIRLPPPHELSPQIAYPTTLPPQPQPPAPASPTPPPIKSPRHQPILVVPPPASDAHNPDKDSDHWNFVYGPSRTPSPEEEILGFTGVDYDVANGYPWPPASGRDQRTLSSITEERASAVSSAMASPNNAPSLRVCFSPALRWYPRAVTDLYHRGPCDPTPTSSRQTLLPTTRLVSTFLQLAWNLPRVCTSHPPCLAMSTGLILSHRCVFPLSLFLHDLVVYEYFPMTVTANLERIL